MFSSQHFDFPHLHVYNYSPLIFDKNSLENELRFLTHHLKELSLNFQKIMLNTSSMTLTSFAHPHPHTPPHTPHMLPHSTRTHTGSLFLKSSVDRIQSFMSRFSFQTPLEDRTATYLQELLNPRGDKTTLEAQKIQEYVRVCLSNMDTPTDTGNNYSSVY